MALEERGIRRKKDKNKHSWRHGGKKLACGMCEACMLLMNRQMHSIKDCQSCAICKSKKRFGGDGLSLLAKQPCARKLCIFELDVHGIDLETYELSETGAGISQDVSVSTTTTTTTMTTVTAKELMAIKNDGGSSVDELAATSATPPLHDDLSRRVKTAKGDISVVSESVTGSSSNTSPVGEQLNHTDQEWLDDS
jgi:hypothetical protein